MENLTIEATKYTPEIFFDSENHLLMIKGESYPENTAEFFTPVLNWIDEYLGHLKEETVIVHFEIIYFNSSTSKVLMDMFYQFDIAVANGKNIRVDWYYLKDDDNILEYGEEFKEDTEHLPFHLIEIDDEEEQ